MSAPAGRRSSIRLTGAAAGDPAIGSRAAARAIPVRRAVTPDAGYGEVGVKVELLVPNHRGRLGEAAMVAARNYR